MENWESFCEKEYLISNKDDVKEQKKRLIGKWGNLGLLDGLSGQMKDNISQLYEQQAKYLINKKDV